MSWWVTGGCARRLLGATRRPADLDLECAGRDASAAAAALGLPLRVDESGGWRSLRAQGTFAGVEVDLSANVEVRGPAGVLRPDDALTSAQAVPAVNCGRPVLCGPPEETLVRALVAGDWSRLERLAARGGRPPRLDYVSARLAASIAAR